MAPKKLTTASQTQPRRSARQQELAREKATAARAKPALVPANTVENRATTTAKPNVATQKVKTGRIQKAKSPGKKTAAKKMAAAKKSTATKTKKPAQKPASRATKSGSGGKSKATFTKARDPPRGSKKAGPDRDEEDEDVDEDGELEVPAAKPSKKSKLSGPKRGIRTPGARRALGKRVEKTTKKSTARRRRGGTSKESRNQRANSELPGKESTTSVSPGKSRDSSGSTAGKKFSTQPTVGGLVQTAQRGAEMLGNAASAVAKRASEAAEDSIQRCRALSEGAVYSRHVKECMPVQHVSY